MVERDWSRRRFVERGSAVGLLASVWGCGPEGRGENAFAEGENAAAEAASPDGERSAVPVQMGGPGQSGPSPRLSLAEPGPMVPPVPAILLTVNGEDGDPDEISVLWTFVVNGDPPQVGVSAGSEHLARQLLEVHSEFVLNVPTASMIQAFDTVDMNSSRIADKFELSGLTRGRATAVDAPTVAEAPIQCECRTIASIEIPPVRKLFIAEVVATTVAEGVVDGDGRLVVPNVPFFGMTAGSGEHFTMGDRIGNIGMTVGRTDIKY